MQNSQLVPGRTDPAADPGAEFDELSVRRLRSRSGAKWRVPDPDVLAAWVADMDFPVAAPIRAALGRLTEAGDLGYPNWPNGRTPLREVFAARMRRRYGWRPDPAEIREFTDVTQAVQAVLHFATEPGDGVVLHTPAFGPFGSCITQLNRRLVSIPMVDTGAGWTFDLDRLAAVFATGAGRVLLLVNPHNPTGHVFSRDELRGLAELAERHDVLVISDEIHADLTYAPHRHVPFASLSPAAEARTVTLTSATKAFNLAGTRCAVGHIGPARVRAALAAVPSALLGDVSVFGVAAAVAAWTEADGWLAGTVDYLDRNRRLIADVLADHLPQVDYHLPEATYLAWLDCRALGWGADPAAIFRDRGRIQLSSGTDFGCGGDGFVRLNFATARPVLERILDRLVCTAAPALRSVA